MKTILDQIFETKRSRFAASRANTDLGLVRETALDGRKDQARHRFSRAIGDRTAINIIAEFKRASPSKGLINGSIKAGDAAKTYADGGARAISVLTEEDFFLGSIDDLLAIRRAVTLPLLRKDFIFDEYQVYESAASGSDAILLIAAALSNDELRDLRMLAEDDLGMDALVEVHTSDEMRRAEAIGANLIGVNNRDLRTFDVSLDVSRELAKVAPPTAILVAESGLRSRDEIVELASLGYSGFLIGETLMRSNDVRGELELLTGKG